MGLIITTEINTDGGSTTSAYLNIIKFDFTKNLGVRAMTQLYLTKASREADDRDTVLSKAIAQRFGVGADDLNPEAMYQSMYAKIRLTLEASGFTVNDDI